MNLVNYLVDIYGYGNPIFIKDVRIGRKSKTAIREEFYRAYKKGDIVRNGPGVYSIINSQEEIPLIVSFDEIIKQKFIYGDMANSVLQDLFVKGYYSGLTFLNMIGISEQVPAIIEITSNLTCSKKRNYTIGKRTAIIRKGRTEINNANYKILQFLDMFSFITKNEIEDNKTLIINYVKENNFTKLLLKRYLPFYGSDTVKKIIEGGLLDAFI